MSLDLFTGAGEGRGWQAGTCTCGRVGRLYRLHGGWRCSTCLLEEEMAIAREVNARHAKEPRPGRPGASA